MAAAVPVSTKMPVPMIAPMPSSVRSQALRLRRSALPPCSTSATHCSIDFVLSRFESMLLRRSLRTALPGIRAIIAGDYAPAGLPPHSRSLITATAAAPAARRGRGLERDAADGDDRTGPPAVQRVETSSSPTAA